MLFACVSATSEECLGKVVRIPDRFARWSGSGALALGHHGDLPPGYRAVVSGEIRHHNLKRILSCRETPNRHYRGIRTQSYRGTQVQSSRGIPYRLPE